MSTTQSNEAVETMNKSTEILTLPNGDSILFSEVALIRAVFSGEGAIHPGVQVSRRAHGLPGTRAGGLSFVAETDEVASRVRDSLVDRWKTWSNKENA